MSLVTVTHALCYGAVRGVMTPAVRFYFRRLDTERLDRIPAHGPALVVANHPSSLTDVLILGVLAPRRLRFVAYSGLFRLRLHGAFLAACGALPIHRREDDAARIGRNARTFDEVHRAFERGEAVVMFPEGTSREDRDVTTFRTGSARLALGYECSRRSAGPLRVVPVGLTFSRRGAFRSDVTLAVGEPLDLEPFVRAAARDLAGAVRSLTLGLHDAVAAEIAHVSSRGALATVHAAEALALDALCAEHPGRPRAAIQRALVLGLERARTLDPERFERFACRLAAHRATLAARGLDARTLAEPPSRRASPRHAGFAALALLGGPFALAGCLLHAPGWAISLAAGAIFGRDPTRLSFARIVAGLAGFSLTYLALAWGLYLGAGLGAGASGAAAVAAAALGLFTLRYLDALARERRRIRIAVLGATRPRRLAALRARQRRLLAVLRAAEREGESLRRSA